VVGKFSEDERAALWEMFEAGVPSSSVKTST
jgi:hypothetical protein